MPEKCTRRAAYKDENGLTASQEDFCRKVSANMEPIDAYDQAFSGAKRSLVPKYVSRLMKNPKIRARIDALRERTLKRHDITVDMLIEELEEARVIALRARIPQAGAAISATMGKAKLCGLEKQVMVHVGADGKDLMPTRIEIVAAKPKQ